MPVLLSKREYPVVFVTYNFAKLKRPNLPLCQGCTVIIVLMVLKGGSVVIVMEHCLEQFFCVMRFAVCRLCCAHNLQMVQAFMSNLKSVREVIPYKRSQCNTFWDIMWFIVCRLVLCHTLGAFI